MAGVGVTGDRVEIVYLASFVSRHFVRANRLSQVPPPQCVECVEVVETSAGWKHLVICFLSLMDTWLSLICALFNSQ